MSPVHYSTPAGLFAAHHSQIRWTKTLVRGSSIVTGETQPAESTGFPSVVNLHKQSQAFQNHIKLLESVDWANTSIGDPSEWPIALRTICSFVLACPFPTALYWGEDLVILYNKPYTELTAQKHPSLLGKLYREGWPEIWQLMEETMENAFYNAKPSTKDDDLLFINRHGFLEECYFSWSLVPVLHPDGKVGGLLNPAFDSTKRVIAERHIQTLRNLGQMAATAQEADNFYQVALESLLSNPYDIPFACIYKIQQLSFVLSASIGLPSNHNLIPYLIDASSPLAEYYITAHKSISYVLFENVEEFCAGSDQCRRGWDIPVQRAVIYPIFANEGDRPSGMLMMGLNPRRPFDEVYQIFLELLSRQLATGMGRVQLFEEDVKRVNEITELSRQNGIELQRQLAQTTKELKQSEMKFTRMAEICPAGIYIADSSGALSYVNQAWSEISGNPKSQPLTEWMDSIHPDDLKLVKSSWEKCFRGEQQRLEYRWKTPYQGKERWTIASSAPEYDHHGQIIGVTGCIMNVSERKNSEKYQQKRAEEAIERKRQQEYFIDMTSHEMRNPLGAIIQTVDFVVESLHNLLQMVSSRKSFSSIDIARKVNENILDMKTIVLCTTHMRRITNDILTLSKVDSNLLLVTPVDFQLKECVEGVLKMFEAELQSKQIASELDFDKSYTELGICWVKADPSRFNQVLINLFTNAIKFTDKRPHRLIKLNISASTERPSLPDSTINQCTILVENPIYLIFSVTDTGSGLKEGERAILFQRFMQATPKTHVKYGGSGLGLFICRKLVELQGGEITVSSVEGQGSTFAFYIVAQRGSNPDDKSMNSLPVVSTSPKLVDAFQLNQSSYNFTLLNLSDLHVLIVEDNVINQRILRKQLNQIGWTTYVANHGQEALEQIAKSKFRSSALDDAFPLDICLVDVEMPVMDGITCVRKIREMEQKGELCGHVPAIAVSANARKEQIDKMIAAGMDDFVTKPYRIPELLEKMKVVLARISGQDKGVGMNMDKTGKV
ncbi:Hybrid signal transduction histidine kinase K [Neolecta irregularis DAH-3]|uniref:Hybrid signal transduction histidine kinase K n=1 Tax=Neolecta irregularis (strain DAH-3) TaxID=1198029 RepID=A0A1U7LU96_NEOID|nr:Hybrid signal transduction histidine kinase K [Neolecta irregularis DAH-3]|eukprot:OLL26091.1 Hybrid signal transduction histidine kinase K [Neolecta irregularis DAH-3]